MMSIKDAALRGAMLVYGLACFFLVGARAFLQGSVTNRLPSTFYARVQQERERFWDLTKQPEGFKHAFYKARNVTLHYVTDAKTAESAKSKNLVIFLHGWPESWVLWRDVWRQAQSKAKDAIYVAVDLPCFGGSGSVPQCTPEGILEPISEFILAMRERHWAPGENGEGEVLLVAHDWGALCGFRLAAEAGGLADRFLLSNAGLPSMILGNLQGRVVTTRRIIGSWLSQPFNFKLLFKAWSNFVPVLVQLQSSFYVAIFNLPYPLPKIFLSLGHYGFLKVVAWIAVGQRAYPQNDPRVATHLAAMLGPPSSGSRTTTSSSSKGALSYPASVLERDHVGSAGNALGFYRDGLMGKEWTKSMELMLALHEIENAHPVRRRSSAGLFDEGPAGAMKAKVTVVFGAKDPALDKRIMLDGIKDYMAKGSQLVMLPKVGHWVPVEGAGPEAFSEAVAWALEGADAEQLEARISSVCRGAKVTISK